MTDWATISSIVTGGSTLVLAVATFSAVRSANRAARVAEEALLVGVRPLLLPSRLDDVQQKVFYGDGKHELLQGGRGAAEVATAGTSTWASRCATRAAVSGCCTAGGSRLAGSRWTGTRR